MLKTLSNIAYMLNLNCNIIVLETNIKMKRGNNMSNNNNNTKVVPEAKAALNQMKLEIASELGMSNYQQVDKGNLTARQNGYVGGYMTKKLVEMQNNKWLVKANNNNYNI